MTRSYFIRDFIKLELPIPIEGIDPGLSYEVAQGFGVLARLQGFGGLER